VMAGMRTHALAAAMFAELLSAYVGQDPGEAFLAALLHDAGEVATYRLVSVGMRESEKKGEQWRPDRSLLWYLAEHYHPRVGVVFFRNWDLAATVVGAMAYHHHPNWAEDGHRRLALLVHVADLLAERSIEHAQSPQWQATVAVRGPFATDEQRALAAHGDGVEHIPIHDLLEQLPPSFNERRIPGLIRSVLLRLDPDELKPMEAGNWN
ncbi:MAG: HDOD domain-containing protein, partial [Myxococcota bacterium]|nr:HDOD domain-containing protein [Myxococcota bacterium]